MKKCTQVEKSLKTILKHGDIFEVVSKRENKAFSKHFMCESFLLIYKPWLVFPFLFGKKLTSFFAPIPIEKVYKAQEEIRTFLGVHVDIIRERNNIFHMVDFLQKKKYRFLTNSYNLSILYEKNKKTNKEYLLNLKKIYSFFARYPIKTVYLKEQDLLEELDEQKLDDLTCKPIYFLLKLFLSKKKISEKFLDFSCSLEDLVYCLSLEELAEVIALLETQSFTHVSCDEFKEVINDPLVKKAIVTYEIDKNIKFLQQIVQKRLVLAFSNNACVKDKLEGKIYQTFRIKDKYIQIVSYTKQGKFLSKQIQSLYDYLEVHSYDELLKKKNSDDFPYVLVAFYLFLQEKGNMTISKNKTDMSLYDYFYKAGQAKKEKKIRKIQGLYEFIDLYNCIYWNVLCTIVGCTLSNSFTDLSSFFEKRTNFVQNSEEQLSTFDFSFSKTVGDSNRSNNLREERILAKITPCKENVALPSYFAADFAYKAKFEKGVQYAYTKTSCPFVFCHTDSLFIVTHFLSEEERETTIRTKCFFVSNTFYPVGSDYALTKIVICDQKDPTKVFEWDEIRNSFGLALSESETFLLSSMERPEISYYYGQDKNAKNIFVNSLYKFDSYTKSSSEEIKKAVLKGLDLEENASINEIHQAIKRKLYSKTPLLDAGLTAKIQIMDELVFFETIASLDSLICNLAATLAVGIDDSLFYVVGCANFNGDAYLKESELHAWAMDKDGTILDITPSQVKKSILDVFEEAIAWGVKNNIPIYGILLFSILLLEKKYGKWIWYYIHSLCVEKILSSSDMSTIYAQLHEILYDEKSNPYPRKSYEWLEKINKDFRGYSKEELQELKKMIKSEFTEEKEKTSVVSLARELSFMQENEEDLERKLRKKENVYFKN